ncbi:sensor domain-containing diguanylate cyclase [Noviherbaspirillum aerium]|uniref:sensor domain-containing diguanylate cyclase n=1 Tax=Noviherbaspirillum aerium TaxID=2588497 RepID=UPI00178C61D7|nr:sensor domain-containing diguanylate cyclase [Noviherbaspirillum aerium]
MQYIKNINVRGLKKTLSGIHCRTFMLSLLAALLAGMVVAAHLGIKEDALRTIERTLDSRNDLARLYFLDQLGKYEVLPETLASSAAVRAALQEPEPAKLHEVNLALAEIAARIGCDRIWVMDLSGKVIADSRWRSLDAILGRNVAYRPYFQDAVEGRTGRFVGIGATSQALGYFLSRPVIIDHRIQGVVALRVSRPFKDFEALLWKDWQAHGKLALVADANGILLMSGLGSWTFKSMLQLDPAQMARMRQSRQYGEHDFTPLGMKTVRPVTADMRFVQFEELPGKTYLQKAYDMREIGGRGYLHADAEDYRARVGIPTGLAALAAAFTFIAVCFLVERWRLQAELLEAAIRDPLTGLYTRLYMQEWLHDAVSAHLRHEERGFSLLLFDIDRFKSINDTYGHLVGDDVLRGVAQLVGSCVRTEDLAVRYGGEEIAVFVRIADPAEIMLLGQRIRAHVEQHGVMTSHGHIRVTVSGGLATHAVGETTAHLFERADKMLYEAKRAGRNRVLSQWE